VNDGTRTNAGVSLLRYTVIGQEAPVVVPFLIARAHDAHTASAFASKRQRARTRSRGRPAAAPQAQGVEAIVLRA
jgi:hypothetical protein